MRPSFLSNRIGKFEERMIPGEARPDLYAAHLTRYRWARRFVRGYVLDAGCSIGYGLKELSHGATLAVGVDAFLPALLYGNERGDFNGVQADIKQLPFRDQVFDIVTSFEVLEHIHEQSCFVQEVHRVLRRDGMFILSTPQRFGDHSGNPHHARELSLDEFRGLLDGRFRNCVYFAQSPRRTVFARLFRRFALHQSAMINCIVRLVCHKVYQIDEIGKHRYESFLIAVCEK